MVTFEMRVKPGKTEAVEYVRIEEAVDTVHRPATDEDRRMYWREYSEFKSSAKPGPKPGVAPKEIQAATEEPAESKSEDETPAEPHRKPHSKKKK